MSGWLQPVEAGLIRPEHAGAVVSPAYDLLSPSERHQHGLLHPRSFLLGTPSEGDDADLDYAGRRAQAQSYLRRELERETWEFRPPSFYMLEITSGSHTQIGLVGDVGADLFPGVIRPHEATRPDRVDDLADYFETVGFASSPVGLAYRRIAEVDRLIEEARGRPPDLDVVLDDGDRQRVWAIDTRDDLAREFGTVNKAYIIDGHHRVAATIHRGLPTEGRGGRFLAVAFPDDQLSIYPFHRWVEKDVADSRARPLALEARPGRAVAVTKEGEWEIDLENQPGEVDVAAFGRNVLREMGIDDERTEQKLMFVPGWPGPKRLRHHVWSHGGIGFLLAPCSIEEVMAHADRGAFMPPKATFFSPKPRSGVFLVRR